MGMPPDPSNYDCFDVDGIRVCIRRGLVTDEEVVIGAGKLLIWESLFVQGILGMGA